MTTETTTQPATSYRLIAPDRVRHSRLESPDLLGRPGVDAADRPLTTDAEATGPRKRLGIEAVLALTF
ncbi:MAG: hypothetical protein R8F63_20665 [Acidimicrobiales bacterium]|nr:hypothetical protein [Acidimicrobiales bacterium]